MILPFLFACACFFYSWLLCLTRSIILFIYYIMRVYKYRNIRDVTEPFQFFPLILHFKNKYPFMTAHIQYVLFYIVKFIWSNSYEFLIWCIEMSTPENMYWWYFSNEMCQNASSPFKIEYDIVSLLFYYLLISFKHLPCWISFYLYVISRVAF